MQILANILTWIWRTISETAFTNIQSARKKIHPCTLSSQTHKMYGTVIIIINIKPEDFPWQFMR